MWRAIRVSQTTSLERGRRRGQGPAGWGVYESKNMRHASLLVVAVAGLAVGCATLSSPWRSPEEDRFEAGVRALTDRNYEKAHSDLSWVAQHYGHEKAGQRALIVLAALEMDPRNPGRRNEVGADVAASYLRLPDRDAWLDPVAQTLYLMGLEMGNAEERTVSQAQPLPTLPGPTVNARIKVVEQERDRLAKRVAALEEQLAQKDRELERIRKTIKP